MFTPDQISTIENIFLHLVQKPPQAPPGMTVVQAEKYVWETLTKLLTQEELKPVLEIADRNQKLLALNMRLLKRFQEDKAASLPPHLDELVDAYNKACEEKRQEAAAKIAHKPTIHQLVQARLEEYRKNLSTASPEESQIIAYLQPDLENEIILRPKETLEQISALSPGVALSPLVEIAITLDPSVNNLWHQTITSLPENIFPAGKEALADRIIAEKIVNPTASIKTFSNLLSTLETELEAAGKTTVTLPVQQLAQLVADFSLNATGTELVEQSLATVVGKVQAQTMVEQSYPLISYSVSRNAGDPSDSPEKRREEKQETLKEITQKSVEFLSRVPPAQQTEANWELLLETYESAYDEPANQEQSYRDSHGNRNPLLDYLQDEAKTRLSDQAKNAWNKFTSSGIGEGLGMGTGAVAGAIVGAGLSATSAAPSIYAGYLVSGTLPTFYASAFSQAIANGWMVNIGRVGVNQAGLMFTPAGVEHLFGEISYMVGKVPIGQTSLSGYTAFNIIRQTVGTGTAMAPAGMSIVPVAFSGPALPVVTGALAAGAAPPALAASTGAATTALTTVGGAGTGAAAGTAVAPVVGTIIGAVIGFVVANLPKIWKWAKRTATDIFKFLAGMSIIIGGSLVGLGAAAITGIVSLPLGLLGGGLAGAGIKSAGGITGALTKLGNAITSASTAAVGLVATEIATPLLVIALSIPVGIALILFIINSSALVVPQNTAGGVGIPGPGGAYPRCWPTVGDLTQGPFCGVDRTWTHCDNNSNAIDIHDPIAPPIYAAHDGTVSTNCGDPKYGNCVKIISPEGFQTLYAHLSQIASLSPGSQITAGTQIGIMGSTGNSTGTHLHYELFPKSWDIRTYVPPWTVSGFQLGVNTSSVPNTCYAKDEGGSVEP